MSFSTFSEAHPSNVVAAVPAPRTLRKSRRFTPIDAAIVVLSVESLSALIRLVVTRAAVVSRPERRIRLADVAVDAPSHVEGRRLVDLLHRLDLPVAGLTRHASVDVSHVRKVNVLGQLVDSYPRHRLLLVPESGELLDLRLVAFGGSSDDGVTAHASPDGRQPGIERFVGGEVAIEAVHLQRVDVNRVAKRDRLDRAVPFRGRSTAVCREHGGERGDANESRHR